MEAGAVLPPLRSDLKLFPAPAAQDGSNQFTLYDPVSGKYLRLGWAEATLFQHWRPGLPVATLLEEIRSNSTLRIDARDAQQFAMLVRFQGLTAPSPDQSGAAQVIPAKGLGSWLRGVFFMRIPLIRPDALLKRTLGWVRWLASSPMLALYLLLTAVGLILMTGRWESYFRTFPHFLSGSGLLAYAAAIIGIKVIHELGHAYAARRYGVHVRSLGLVFFLLWPVPYADVTDGWRLPGRRPRFLIGFAGIAVEIALGGLSLFGWVVSSPGLYQSLFFMVSSATLVSTIAVNLNPLLRFDGYYLLSDLWNLDNLRSRSTAVARWSIRLWLLGLKNDSPEPIFARSRLLGMTAYALFGWLYRLGVYAALALLAFHALFKVAGIALLMLIAVNLIARPIALEARELWKLRRQWWGTRRSVVTVSVAALAFAWVAAPLPRAVAAPAILVPVTEQTFFVPFDGIVSEMSAARGRIVRKGEKLLTIRSPELEAQWAALKGEAAALAALLDSTRHDPARRSSVKEAEEKLAKTRQEMALVADRLDRSVVRSTVAGTITEWIDSRIEGQSIAEGWYLGRIANVAEWRLVGYVEERDREAISPGTQIKFYAAEAGVSWEGRIRAIAPAQTQIIFHPGLTSTAGGPIEVVGRTPLKAYFEVDVGLDVREGRIPKGYSGSMRFRTPPQSLLVRGLALLWIALIRESGF